MTWPSSTLSAANKVVVPSEGRSGRHAGGAARWLGGPATAEGSAPKHTGGPICQASPAAPKLGRNIRPVTRKQVVGSLEPDGRLKFLSAIRRIGLYQRRARDGLSMMVSGVGGR